MNNAFPYSRYRLAGVVRRLVVAAIDVPILFWVWRAGFPCVEYVRGLPLRAHQHPEWMHFTIWTAAAAWVPPAVLVLLCWWVASATPGNLLTGTRLIDARTGGRPRLVRLLPRLLPLLIVGVISSLDEPTEARWGWTTMAQFAVSLTVPASYFLVAFDSRRQGWHDKLAGTMVVTLAPPTRAQLVGRLGVLVAVALVAAAVESPGWGVFGVGGILGLAMGVLDRRRSRATDEAAAAAPEGTWTRAVAVAGLVAVVAGLAVANRWWEMRGRFTLGGANQAVAARIEAQAPQLCYVRGTDVWLSSVHGEDAVRVLRGSFDPRLDPDGRRIAYTNESRAGRFIEVLDLGSHATTRLAGVPGENNYGPSWSPDGGWLALQHWHDRAWDAAVVRPDGSDFRILTESLGGRNRFVQIGCWSADGTFLWIFDQAKLYRIDLQGHVLHEASVKTVMPECWSSNSDCTANPDGRSVLWHVHRNDRDLPQGHEGCGCPPTLVLYDVASETTKRVGPRGMPAGGPAWAPDGRSFYFTGAVRDFQSDVYLGSVDGGEPTLVIPGAYLGSLSRGHAHPPDSAGASTSSSGAGGVSSSRSSK